MTIKQRRSALLEQEYSGAGSRMLQLALQVYMKQDLVAENQTHHRHHFEIPREVRYHERNVVERVDVRCRTNSTSACT